MELEKEIHQAQFRNEFQKAVLNIYFTSNWLSGIQNAVFKPYGLSPQQYNILRILRGQYPKPASVNLLIERMLDKMSNASRLVEKLRQKGLVERKSCDEDRRRVDVQITKSGLDLLTELEEKVQGIENRFQKISPEEAKTLNQILDKLRG